MHYLRLVLRAVSCIFAISNQKMDTMKDHHIYGCPGILNAITTETKALGFSMVSEPKTGTFLRTLAASKPNGRFLELGTGTGLSTAWILDGMDDSSSLTSVDNDKEVQRIACKHLGNDPRVEFICEDGALWLEKNQSKQFDFIFADAWPGKFSHLDLALDILSAGGLYIIDDLLPQDSWPDGHAPKVPRLIEDLESKTSLESVCINWASGLMLVTKTNKPA